MNSGFIFHRNLSTNQPFKLDYTHYFYSAELVESMLDDAPLVYKETLSKNLLLRNQFVLRVLTELESYLEKPIYLISPTSYKDTIERLQISHVQMHLTLFEESNLEPFVDKVIRITQTKPVSVQNFTKFQSLFKLTHDVPGFTPKLKSEWEVLKLINEYPLDRYDKRRTMITPSGVLISNYTSCGVITVEQVLDLLNKRPSSGGKTQLIRQLKWAYYSKLKPTGAPYFPLLPEDQSKKYMRFITGTLQGDLVEDFLNKQIHNMNNGGLVSNRTRLMLSHYLIIKLGLYWEYGELYFRSVLADYHPKINRYNWFAQSRNRYLKCYNLTRQLDIYGDK